MNKRLKTILFLTVCDSVLSVVGSGSAHALTRVVSPFADASVHAEIGMNAQGPVTLVVWQRKYDGACRTTVIGNGLGLNDDYQIVGGNGHDSMYAVTPDGSGGTFCGFWMAGLAYNGHFLDLAGGAGNDSLAAESGDTWLWGDDGNDTLFFTGGGQLLGGNGNDRLISAGSGFSAEGLAGGPGSDCLEDYSGAAWIFDCGTGTDTYSTLRPSMPNNCEMPFAGHC
jgi:Ca2+-binding RTX toxin-like protein